MIYSETTVCQSCHMFDSYSIQRVSLLTLPAKVTLHLLTEKEGREMSRILHEDFLRSDGGMGLQVAA